MNIEDCKLIKKIGEPVWVDSALLEAKFNVRKEIDKKRLQDFIHDFRTMDEHTSAKGIVPDLVDPILAFRYKLTGKWVVVDGRTRLEAAQSTRRQILVQEIEEVSEKSAYTIAVFCNWGGAAPPLEGDMIKVYTRWMMDGKTSQELHNMFPFTPKLKHQRWFRQGQSNISLQNKRDARDAVLAGGTSMEEAAEVWAVPLGALQIFMGHKPGRGETNMVVDIQMAIVKAGVHIARCADSGYRRIIRALEEFGITAEEATMLLELADDKLLKDKVTHKGSRTRIMNLVRDAKAV